MEAAPAPEAPPAERVCPNCGAPAPGRFCPACGQRQDRKLASLRRMAAEGLQDQLSLGAELPVTLASLVFHPGRLTQEYLAGRIARYVPPLRLYLVASLAFFFLLSFTADFRDPLRQASDDIAAARDSARAATGADSAAVGLQLGDENSLGLGISFDTTDASRRLTPLKRWAQHRVDRLNAMDRDELGQRFLDGFQRNAPRAVFLLLPIYALFLKLLYARNERLYAEHFVFALHVHAFVFVLFTLMFLTPEWLDPLLVLVWLPVYVFFAMLRVYGQSVAKTVAKYGLLSFAYCTALLVLLVATALVTAFTI